MDASLGPLKPQQLVLLKRLAGGDDLSGPDGVDQRGRVYALQNRGLVQVRCQGTPAQCLCGPSRQYKLISDAPEDVQSRPPFPGGQLQDVYSNTVARPAAAVKSTRERWLIGPQVVGPDEWGTLDTAHDA